MSESDYVYSDAGGAPGRSSFEDAPEAGGTDDFRREFSDASKQRRSGVFGNAAQQEVPKNEPLDVDTALSIQGENLALRQRVAEAEVEAEAANEERLDSLAYNAHDTREEYEEVADELLLNGGGDRLEALVASWHERDPQGADAWAEVRSHNVVQAMATVNTTVEQQLRQERSDAYEQELAGFLAEHPEYSGGARQQMLVSELAGFDASVAQSPQTFRLGLEQARERCESVAKAALGTAQELQFRNEFRQEMRSSFHQPAADHIASAEARRTQIDLANEIMSRTRGTKAERAAAINQRHQDIRAATVAMSRGSGFGNGAREQAARAIKTRDAEDADRRSRRPGTF